MNINSPGYQQMLRELNNILKEMDAKEQCEYALKGHGRDYLKKLPQYMPINYYSRRGRRASLYRRASGLGDA